MKKIKLKQSRGPKRKAKFALKKNKFPKNQKINQQKDSLGNLKENQVEVGLTK